MQNVAFRNILKSEFAPIKRGLDYVLSQTADPWELIHTEVSNVIKQNEASFLEPVSAFYGTERQYYCMVLGKNVTHSEIICSHIWPKHTGGRGLELFDLQTSDVNNPRNFLRLHKSIKNAFDHKRLTFIPTGAAPSADGSDILLNLVILDPQLMKESFETSGSTIAFADLHDKPMDYIFRQNKQPFMRLLDNHTKQAFEKARANGWIDQEEESAGRQRANELARMSIGLSPSSDSVVMDLFFKND